MGMPGKPTILLVDDERIVLMSLKSEIRANLGNEARIETADSGAEALAVMDSLEAEGAPLALVISDLRMPGMNGDALLSRVRERQPDALHVLLTGYADLDAVANAINNGGLYRYLSKPWRREDLVVTAREALKAWRNERTIREKNRAIEQLTVGMVTALENVNLVSDEETGLHVLRVGEYSRLIAEAMGCEESFVKRIGLYGSLHDIGKVGVPKEILVSGMRYTPEERQAMMRHVEYGGRMLDMTGIDPMARNVALFHHERWDGSGYASGLAGEEIPLEARIVSVADVFDALTTMRVYKTAFTAQESAREIESLSGSAFDPAVVAAFLSRLEGIASLRAGKTAREAVRGGARGAALSSG
jgi:putative two-component system response regulator